MFTLGLAFIIVSLCRPQWGFNWEKLERRGLDIIIALDVSKSMLATDIKPDRIKRAKLEIESFVKKIKGDRLGLVVFTSQAFLQCPLTLDYGGFLFSLENVDTNTLPVGGTSLFKAIKESLLALKDTPREYRLIILITDGEDHEGKVWEAVQEAKNESVKIFCIGVGSPEGELIPVKDRDGNPVFLKDKQGRFIKSRLNEELLEKIALSTGGSYIRATSSEFGLNLLYEEKIAKMEGRQLKSNFVKRYEERYQIFLTLAFFLLLAELLLPEN